MILSHFHCSPIFTMYLPTILCNAILLPQVFSKQENFPPKFGMHSLLLCTMSLNFNIESTHTIQKQWCSALTDITHAALQTLSLTVRNTLPLSTLSSLQTRCPICHFWTSWTLWWTTRAPWFLFTSCWLGITTLHLCWHKLAVLAAWWIFVTARSSLVAT